ncbi:MAG: hypothetical protein D5R96_09440, partial [Methanocalculus sp. MSAO_Arc2]
DQVRYGVTLTFSEEGDREKWEPHAAPTHERIEALKKAYGMGIDTWVSIEPVIDPIQSLELIRVSAPFTHEFKIGKLNHNKTHEAGINWVQFGNCAIELCEDLKVRYTLKEDLVSVMQRGEEITPALEKMKNGALFTSDSPEWYTPDDIISRVIRVFGTIDLDPCSNGRGGDANVPARNHYTLEENGLNQEWKGRVYMNPPYGNEIQKWISKLKEEYEAGNVQEAIALVPARTDTKWFNLINKYLRCEVSGRLKFKSKTDPDQNDSAPFPSAIFYLGKNETAFSEAFSERGLIVKPIQPEIAIPEVLKLIQGDPELKSLYELHAEAGRLDTPDGLRTFEAEARYHLSLRGGGEGEEHPYLKKKDAPISRMPPVLLQGGLVAEMLKLSIFSERRQWVSEISQGERTIIRVVRGVSPFNDPRLIGRLKTEIGRCFPLYKTTVILEELNRVFDGLINSPDAEKLTSEVVLRAIDRTERVWRELYKPPVYAIEMKGKKTLYFSASDLAKCQPLRINEQWMALFNEQLGARGRDFEEIIDYWISEATEREAAGIPSIYEPVFDEIVKMVSVLPISKEKINLVTHGIWLESGPNTDGAVLWVRSDIVTKIMRSMGKSESDPNLASYLIEEGKLKERSRVHRIERGALRAWGFSPDIRPDEFSEDGTAGFQGCEHHG